MRSLLLWTAAVFVLAAFPLCAQSHDDAKAVVHDITEAMVGGDSDVLARVSAPQLVLTVDGQTSVFTRGQARYVTGAFLDQHPVKTARVEEVNIVGRQCTARSRLEGSDRSETWNLFLRLRRTGAGWELKELRVTPVDTPNG